MLLALCLAAASAFASDLSTSLWHPGAAAMDRGFHYLGPATVLAADQDFAGTWVGVTGAWAPTRRLAVSGTGLVAVGSTVVAGGARFNIIESRWFRGGPVVFGGGWDHTENETSRGVGVGLGVAAEGGFTRVRFDTFVPVLVTTHDEGPLQPTERLPGFDHLDFGVSVRMGSSHANRLRGGLGTGGASFAYQHVGEHWFMEVAVGAGGRPVVSGTMRGGMVF